MLVSKNTYKPEPTVHVIARITKELLSRRKSTTDFSTQRYTFRISTSICLRISAEASPTSHLIFFSYKLNCVPNLCYLKKLLLFHFLLFFKHVCINGSWIIWKKKTIPSIELLLLGKKQKDFLRCDSTSYRFPLSFHDYHVRIFIKTIFLFLIWKFFSIRQFQIITYPK